MSVFYRQKEHWQTELTEIIGERNRRGSVVPIDVLLDLDPGDLTHTFQFSLCIIAIVAAESLRDNVEILVDVASSGEVQTRRCTL